MRKVLRELGNFCHRQQLHCTIYEILSRQAEHFHGKEDVVENCSPGKQNGLLKHHRNISPGPTTGVPPIVIDPLVG